MICCQVDFSMRLSVVPAVSNKRHHEQREEQPVQGEEGVYEEIDESADGYERVDGGERWKKEDVFELQQNAAYATTK